MVLSGHVVIIYTEANLDNETGKPNFSSEENAFVKFQKICCILINKLDCKERERPSVYWDLKVIFIDSFEIKIRNGINKNQTPTCNETRKGEAPGLFPMQMLTWTRACKKLLL